MNTHHENDTSVPNCSALRPLGRLLGLVCHRQWEQSRTWRNARRDDCLFTETIDKSIDGCQGVVILKSLRSTTTASTIFIFRCKLTIALALVVLLSRRWASPVMTAITDVVLASLWSAYASVITAPWPVLTVTAFALYIGWCYIRFWQVTAQVGGMPGHRQVQVLGNVVVVFK